MRTPARVLPAVLMAACAHPAGIDHHALEQRAHAIVTAEDRSEADQALDHGRRPEAFLLALGVGPGMKVGELFAGGGYTTELLARAVAPGGVVYAENPKWVLERPTAKTWAERLARSVNQLVVRADRELEDPFPPEAEGALELVVTNANYHDTVWLEVDRDAMNRRVHAALGPKGRYAVIDTSAAPGHGLADVKTLHRIDEGTVRAEVERAGFVLERSEDVLRNPEDTRDWNVSPSAAGERRGTGDRFMLIFVKR